MEYSTLLDTAASPHISASDRLLFVTAFAISSLSGNRVKERSGRKPFNPILGETFELIREDRGYRFLAEKVCHRPACMAWHAESARWSVNQSPLPTQKFWGKSAELIVDGHVRLALHETGDRYSWTGATCFLRNIIAGEKYLEPVNTITVHDERNGTHAVVEFAKAKGLFAGRSEGVTALLLGPRGAEPLDAGLVGKWTSDLATTTAPDDPIWTAGDLVPAAPRCYGFTTFAASLNELLPRDAEALPPSDSRLQQRAEEGDLDTAEGFKKALEEAQRERRRELEERGRSGSRRGL